MEALIRKTSRFVFLFIFCICAGISLALAQLPTATILGTVKDATGAIVPDGTVTVRNTETGMARTEKSGASGSFRFVALPVGVYEVRAEHSGFRAEVRDGVALAVGQEAVVNFALQVGVVEQTVEVTGEAPLVNTTSGSLGGLVGSQQVADLPLNGRNYVDLTLLQPGVVQHRPGTPSALGAGTWFSANGAPPRSNWYLLDGAAIGNAWGGTAASAGSNTLGIEGIREWRVVTNSSGAEYGMRMGGQMTLVSKGGTNNFHGSLLDYFRNSALDARNFFDYTTPQTPRRLPGFTRNQFGGSVGGPIRKDKAFFFATYEGLRQRLGITTVSSTLPPEAKVDNGQISPVIKPLLTLFPDPNLSGNRYTFPSSQAINDDYGQVRGDYNLSTSDTLFARYTIDPGQEVDPLAFPQFTRIRESKMQFLTASETHTFSPALLGTFRFSFSRTWIAVHSHSGIVSPQFSFLPGQEVGDINIGGVTSLGPDAQTPNGYRQNIFTGSGDLFYMKGRHSLKFGSLINRYDPMYVQGGSNSFGNVTFPDVASFLAGKPSTYAAVTPGSVRGRTYAFNTLGFYLQDDLQARPNLTFNLGLRYEFHTDITEVNGHGSVLRDLYRDATYTVGLPFLNPSLKNFSPRFGFAWDVQGNGKTAVRGGFGLLYDIADWGAALLLTSVASPPFSAGSTVVNPPSFAIPLFFPDSAIGKSVRATDYHMRQPHMLNFNLTVERQLPANMSLSLAYAGSRGLNLLASEPEGNPTIPTILPDGRPFWTGREPRINLNWGSINYSPASVNSWYNSLQFLITKRMSHGLQFQSSYTWSKLIDEKPGVSSDDSGGSTQYPPDPLHRSTQRGLSDYNLAQVWRFNAIYRLPGVTGSGSFARSMLNGWWVSGILSAQTGLPFTPTLTSNRSLSQNNSGGANIDHPDLIAGRSFSSMTQRVSTGCGNIPAGTPLGNPARWFDPCAFSIQPAGFLGTAGRNILSGPGVANLDFSLVKDTSLRRLGEGGKLEFRAEFFNILNHANFARPNSVVYAARANVEAPLNTAGQITSTVTTSRQIQFALKVLW